MIHQPERIHPPLIGHLCDFFIGEVTWLQTVLFLRQMTRTKRATRRAPIEAKAASARTLFEEE